MKLTLSVFKDAPNRMAGDDTALSVLHSYPDSPKSQLSITIPRISVTVYPNGEDIGASI